MTVVTLYQHREREGRDYGGKNEKERERERERERVNGRRSKCV